MSAASVLGVLDWGVGGFGVVRALRAHGVTTSIVYISDTGALPYGRMSSPALAARVEAAIAQLTARGATRVLIACNAASTVLDAVQSPVPVSGVIAPVLRAMKSDRSRTVGVISGARTTRSGLYRRGLARAQRTVIQRVAQPLSAHIEAGTVDSEAARRDLQRILSPLRDVDALVLACTHYPSIAALLQTYAPRARLIDPAAAVVAELAPHLPRGDRSLRALTTGDPRAMRRAALRVWGLETGACDRVAF